LAADGAAWRVYDQRIGATGENLAFMQAAEVLQRRLNSTAEGYARFSPMKRPDGSVVTTLDAGTTLEVALMEIVLRDVPTRRWDSN